MKPQQEFDCVTKMPKDLPHHNMGRVLTVRLKITDPSKSDWIWKHENNSDLGVHITACANGDGFWRESLMEETLGKAMEVYGDRNGIIQKTFDELDKRMLQD